MVLLTYELSNLLILGSIGVVFRPQEYSPFFIMVPARLNDERIRPIPILEGKTVPTVCSVYMQLLFLCMDFEWVLVSVC